MSRFDYEVSKHLAAEDHPFHALVMAAMRKADDENGDKLRAAFPLVWAELWARYHAPGGLLADEQVSA